MVELSEKWRNAAIDVAKKVADIVATELKQSAKYSAIFQHEFSKTFLTIQILMGDEKWYEYSTEIKADIDIDQFVAEQPQIIADKFIAYAKERSPQ